MTSQPHQGTTVPIAYRFVAAWLRVVTPLVPKPVRGRWVAEWDGELWYGILGERQGLRTRARRASGLAVGLLRDALDMRRLEGPNRGRQRGDRGAAGGGVG